MIVLRSLVFHVFFYVTTLLFCLAGLPLRLAEPARSESMARAWVAVVLAGARVLCGIRLVLTGAENLPSGGAALIASQHQSAYDTLVWMRLVPRATYVVKQELIRIPLFGPMLRQAGMIGVDRAAGAAALRGLLQEAGAACASGRQIVIFPQGTRVAPGVRVKLQPGIAALALRLDLPVIPVATDSGRRWGRRMFRLQPGPVHVAVCPALAKGTPRVALLEGIEAAWRQAEQGFVEAVDKPVDGAVSQARFIGPNDA